MSKVGGEARGFRGVKEGTGEVCGGWVRTGSYGRNGGGDAMTAHPGIILAVTATVIYNLGFICEKRALDHLPAIEAHRLGHLARTLFTAPAWLAGFLLICCGLVLQLLVLLKVQ